MFTRHVTMVAELQVLQPHAKEGQALPANQQMAGRGKKAPKGAWSCGPVDTLLSDSWPLAREGTYSRCDPLFQWPQKSVPGVEESS
jgi:hypothetical protein